MNEAARAREEVVGLRRTVKRLEGSLAGKSTTILSCSYAHLGLLDLDAEAKISDLRYIFLFSKT